MSIDEIREEFLDRLTVCAKEHKIQLDNCENTLTPGLALHIFNAAVHMLLEDLEGRGIIERRTSVDFQKNCFMKCWELTRRTRAAQSPGPNTNPGFHLSLDPSLGFYLDLGHSTTNGRVVKILIIRAYAHKIIDWSGVNW